MSVSLDSQIQDAVLKHALDLTRVEAGLRERVMLRLLSLQRELLALLGSDAPKTRVQTDAMLAKGRKAIDTAYAEIYAMTVVPALRVVAETQVTHLTNTLEGAKVPKLNA